MSTHNLDRLFREKLTHHESQPSAEAWEKVSHQLQQKKNGTARYYRIAAAVTILLVSAALIYNLRYNTKDEFSSVIAINASSPTEETFDFQWNITIKKEESTTNQKEYVQMPETKSYATLDIEKPFSSQLDDELSLTSIEDATIRSFDYQLTQTIDVLGTSQPKVRIQYIAENQTEVKEKGIKKFINYARTASPVDIFSDIRTAKDQFISEKISLD